MIIYVELQFLFSYRLPFVPTVYGGRNKETMELFLVYLGVQQVWAKQQDLYQLLVKKEKKLLSPTDEIYYMRF